MGQVRIRVLRKRKLRGLGKTGGGGKIEQTHRKRDAEREGQREEPEGISKTRGSPIRHHLVNLLIFTS